MRIQLLNGGLGNQTFQYIFSRWIELSTNEVCYLDDRSFFIFNAHNGFEISKVFPNSKCHLLSEYFSEDVWEYIVKSQKTVPEILKESGQDIAMVAETSDYKFSGNVVQLIPNIYHPELAASKGDLYYHGYWINRDWYKNEYYNILKKELEFAPITEPHNLEYQKKIENEYSISLHVRRGDFVDYGYAANVERYAKLVTMAKERIPEGHFFIFSDDLEWCRANLKEMGLYEKSKNNKVTFVEGNSGQIAFRDMQLMSMCKTNILTTSSSFSYLACLLNENAIVLNGTGREV